MEHSLKNPFSNSQSQKNDSRRLGSIFSSKWQIHLKFILSKSAQLLPLNAICVVLSLKSKIYTA